MLNQDAQIQFDHACHYADEENHEKEFYWLYQAAKKGHVDAQYNMALIYQQGNIIPQNDQKAAYWYTLAANEGDADAQNALGNMYYFGHGVEQDNIKAYTWYKKAALSRHALGKENMILQWLENHNVTETDHAASEKLRKKIRITLEKIRKSGREKLGNGAYTTTFTSVGKDILQGAAYAEDIIDYYLKSYVQDNDEKDRQILASLLEEMMDEYEANHTDMEGFGVGTIRDVICALEEKD